MKTSPLDDQVASVTPAGESTGTSAALRQAALGAMPILDLLNAVQQNDDAGLGAANAELYRTWLAHHDSPLSYVAEFNLGVLLSNQGDGAGAEAAYRAVLARQPGFAQAYLNLGLELERAGRPEEALQCWSAMLGSVNLAVDHAWYVQGLNHLGGLLAKLGRLPQAEAMLARSLQREPAQPGVLAEHMKLRLALAGLAAERRSQGRTADPGDLLQPLVSILIPTHNRPHFAELALQSALDQTYGNVEIVISDNGDDERTSERLAPYAARHACIRYLRAPDGLPSDNFLACLDAARGEYINFLMDDDLFHPEKITKMMDCMLGRPDVGLVTSFRQLIDQNGDALPPEPTMARLLEQPALLSGRQLFWHMLTHNPNVVGQPTAALFRKRDLNERFGMFHGKQYVASADLATWLSILERKDCVYLPEPLSSCRRHGGPERLLTTMQIVGRVERLQMFCDAYEHSAPLLAGPDARKLLATNLTDFIADMAAWAGEIEHDNYDLESIHTVIRQATHILLQPSTGARGRA